MPAWLRRHLVDEGSSTNDSKEDEPSRHLENGFAQADELQTRQAVCLDIEQRNNEQQEEHGWFHRAVDVQRGERDTKQNLQQRQRNTAHQRGHTRERDRKEQDENSGQLWH